MSMERAILKGELAELKMKKMELETAISANIKAVKNALAAASVTPIARIDVEGALVNLKEAAEGKKKLAEVVAMIERVNDELA